MQDDLQAFRIYEVDRCVRDLQLPCHWVPDAGYGFGYPLFLYYSPSVYYLGEGLHLLGFQIIDSVKILFILGFVLSAVVMFIFLKSWLGEWPAFFGALLYTYAPFKAVEVYVRGAMSEFWAFVFFPLIFWSSLQFIKTGRRSYFVWLAVSGALLLLTHNLMSMIFFPLAFVWTLIWVILEKRMTILPSLILAYLLGLGLSAFFILPLALGGKDVHLETLLGGYFDYRQHFVDLKQLFLSNYWGYGSSVLGPNDDLSLSVGVVHWLVGLLAAFMTLLYFRQNKKIFYPTFILVSLELLVLFLMHQRSSFVWSWVTPLVWLQFPWRFLSISVFILSTLGGVLIHLLAGRNKSQITFAIILLVTVSLFILHAHFFQPKDWFELTDGQKFSGPLWEKELTISIFDYLPKSATLPPNHKAPDLPEILSGQASFITYTKGSNYQKGQLLVGKEATLRIPLFDFPGMEVRIDGKKIKFVSNNCQGEPYCFGLITVEVPKGSHTLQVRLADTIPVRVGNLISLGSILILISLAFFKKNEYRFI